MGWFIPRGQLLITLWCCNAFWGPVPHRTDLTLDLIWVLGLDRCVCTTAADCVATKTPPPALSRISDSSTMSCNKVHVVQMRNLYHTNAVHATEETSCWIFWALTTMPRNTCGDKAFLSQTFFYGGCTIAPFVQMLNLLKCGWEYTFLKIQTILKIIHHQVTMLLIFTFSGV